LFLRNPKVNMGLARRISSGALMQFLGREDFLWNGIPTLGFYGQFSPLVQGYSCAESPFWFGKAFLCLHLPAEHPFWTAVENNGTWEKLGENEVKVTVLNGPALCFSNHQANGETILRSGKVVKDCGDRHGMWNYSKLCFNSKYPWEATPKGTEDGEAVMADLVESQQYVMEDWISGEKKRANVTLWYGEKNQVLYRRQFFNYTLREESHWIQAMNLADFTVPYGIIRADKLRVYRDTIRLTLGAYGFPDNGTEITYMEKDEAKAIVLKGHDFTGKEKQLAMTVFDGWDEITLLHSEGTNPDSEKSIVVYGKLARGQVYDYEPFVLISQVITKESFEDFEEDEIFPIASVSYTDPQGRGGYGPVTITLKDGTVRVIEFEQIEGQLML